MLGLFGIIFGVVLFVAVIGEWLGLFETLTGRVPFRSRSQSLSDLGNSARLLHQQPAPLVIVLDKDYRMERFTAMTETQSVITCPECSHQQMEEMPTHACQFFYRCTSCGAVLRPKEGDCCVFCSYGSVPCPPIQRQRLLGGD